MSYSTIKFGNNLIKNKTCTITYSGMLFQNGSEFVNIVYGFGNEWHHTKEQEMEKTDDGFVVEVNMLDYDTFNFCFRNSNYEWDNNNYQNYTAPITEEIQEDVDFIINDDTIITTIIDNLSEIDVSTANDEVVQIIGDVETPGILEASEAVESIVPNENAPFEIEVEKNTPVDIEESLVNVTEAEGLDKDIENLFTDIYQEISSSEQESSENNFNMNSLIDEILSPVVQSNIFEDEINVDTVSTDESSNFFEDLNDLDEDLSLDNKIDALITDLFNNTKSFAENKEFNQENINNDKIATTINEEIEKIISEPPLVTEEKTKTSEIIHVEIKEKIPDFTIINDEEEESIIESLNDKETDSNDKQTALVEVNTENDFVVSPRSLGKFYMFKKKVKLAFTKLFVKIPKLLKGFYTENNN